MSELELQKQVLALRKKGLTLRKIADMHGVKFGTIAWIERGIFPRDPETRQKLGLNSIMTIEACWCDKKVHIKKHRKPFHMRVAQAEDLDICEQIGILRIYYAIKLISESKNSPQK